MPIYRECQKIGSSLTGVCQKVGIRYNINHWEVNKWDGNGWVDLSDGTRYVPDFSVRTMKVIGAVGESAIVHYNLAGYSGNVVSEATVTPFETGIIETFSNLQVYVERVTMVYLTGSSSTFTQLSLGS